MDIERTPNEIYERRSAHLSELTASAATAMFEESQAQSRSNAAVVTRDRIRVANDDPFSEEYRCAIQVADRASADLSHASRTRSAAVNSEFFGYRTVMNELHDHVTDTTSPMEYLFTAAKLVTLGHPENVQYQDEVERSHETLSYASVPVAIIGSGDAVLAFGLSKGGYHVRRFRDNEIKLDEISAAVVDIPLVGVHLYGAPVYEGFETTPIEHEVCIASSLDQDPILVRVMQHITSIRTANSKAGVEAAIIDLASIETPDVFYQSVPERTGDIAGMVPLVAYGQEAVVSVVKSIAERVSRTPQPQLHQGDLYAMAANVGIEIPELDNPLSDEIDQLHKRFIHGVGILIRDQVEVTLAGMLGSKTSFSPAYWPAAATTKVMHLIGREEQLADIARSHLQPLFVEATNASDNGRARTATRVASALGETFGIEIDPKRLVA